MSFEGLLNETADIYGKTRTQQPSGEIAASWAAVATDVKTRCVAEKNPTVTAAPGHVTVTTHRFYFLASQAVTQGQRIMYHSEAYDIITAEKDSSGHHLEVAAQKVSFE